MCIRDSDCKMALHDWKMTLHDYKMALHDWKMALHDWKMRARGAMSGARAMRQPGAPGAEVAAAHDGTLKRLRT